ncbi:PepSY domain-containing protein [Elioraea rosea]|uniref:PepSY domain-containing protein n=1 Tax=Elioraea rosea TaxID=2492390 RepID=UPI001182A365|nr:PepSY domain-containing protein [Elioraea rosea]
MTPTKALGAAGLSALLLAAPVMAQTQVPTGDGPRAERSATDRDGRSERLDRERADRNQAVLDARVGAADAIRIAEQAGFRGVHEVEWERGLWEIDALDASGGRVKLLVDAQSGALVQQQRR